MHASGLHVVLGYACANKVMSAHSVVETLLHNFDGDTAMPQMNFER